MSAVIGLLLPRRAWKVTKKKSEVAMKQKWNCLAFILPFMLMQACTDDHPCNGSFYINDSKITEQHYDKIVEAGDNWNRLIGKNHFTIGTTGMCPIHVQDLPVDYLAMYHVKDGQAEILIDPQMLVEPVTLTQFTIIMMHELGHSENLQHVAGGTAIMNERLNERLSDRELKKLMGQLSELDHKECLRAELCR